MPLRLYTSMPPLRPVHRWLNGGPVRESDLRGRPVLIHFWALSCASCKEHLERVTSLRGRFERLEVISVHTPLAVEDMDDDRVEDAVRAYEIQYPVALDGDDGALADAYHVHLTPSYFVFDSQGRLRHYHAGPHALDAVERAIAHVLEEEAGGRDDAAQEAAGTGGDPAQTPHH